MSNLKSLLEPLSSLAMPDRWSDIERRPVNRLEEGRNRSRMTAAAVSVAAAALALVVVFQLAPLTTKGPSDGQFKEPNPVPAWVAREAHEMASAFADPAPASAKWMLTDANTAASAVGLEEGDPNQEVYLVVLEGRFTALMSHPPAGDKFQEGAVLAFTLDTSRHKVLDWSLSDRPVDLPGLQSIEPSGT
jgi:hypothetical protein